MAATPNPTAIRVPKAGEIVAAQLRRQIMTGELEAGDTLPTEAQLMERFGVSRPTLREAFLILESEKLIQIRRGSRGGARVLVPDAGSVSEMAGRLLQYRGTTIGDVYAAKTMLECAVVETLAKNRTAEDLRWLDDALADGERLLESPAGAEYSDLAGFHRLLAEVAGNQTHHLLLDIVLSVIDRHNQTTGSWYRADPATQLRSARAAHRAHTKLVELIRQKATAKAVAFWKRHLDQLADARSPEPSGAPLDVLAANR